MDAIVRKSDHYYSIDTPSETLQDENPLSTKSPVKEGILQKFRTTFSRRTVAKPGPIVGDVAEDGGNEHQSKFTPGDRVVVYTVQEEPVWGTVRWTGPIKMGKVDGGDIITAVGIETVSFKSILHVYTCVNASRRNDRFFTLPKFIILIKLQCTIPQKQFFSRVKCKESTISI